MRIVISQVDALRVSFVEAGGNQQQIVQRSVDCTVPVIDLASIPAPDAAAKAWMSADFAVPVDIARGPLFNLALLKVAKDRFYLYERLHHILVDGFGILLFTRLVANIQYLHRLGLRPLCWLGRGRNFAALVSSRP